VIRLASWIVFSLLITAAIAWMIALPGTLTVEVGGYRAQPRLGTAVFMLAAIIAGAIVLWTIFRRLWSTPNYLARRAREKRREQGVDALSDGFVALQAGDAARARLLAREARARLPANTAAQLLEARADLMLGDMPSAREHYRALISDKKTAVAALAGLYEQARLQGRADTALTFAHKAAALAPATPWASSAVFDDLARNRRWSEALQRLAVEPAVSRSEREAKKRRQAVLETALARDAEETEPLIALEHAQAALKLLPDFVPAALIAARVQSSRGDSRKAMSLLRRVWRLTNHSDVAALYAHSVPGGSAVERFRRMRELIETPAPDAASAMALARAAIDAFEWAVARNVLAPFSVREPTQGVCLLMAEIEEGQNGDGGKAREWLGRAVRAPRDPAWTADGVTVEEWEPTSPISGKLDALEWKVPVSAQPARPIAITDASEAGAGPIVESALPAALSGPDDAKPLAQGAVGT